MMLFSRIGLILTISIALVFALLSNNIITYITQMIGVLMSGLCVCGLLGRLWPKYNWQGAIATLIAGMTTAIFVSSTPEINDFFGNSVLPAVIGAAIAGVSVTLVTRHKSRNTNVSATSELVK
jgi:SSS family solute:Na+ symporter